MAQVFVRATRFVAKTTLGTQDITISGFGTPKGVLFLWSRASSDGLTTGSVWGMGCAVTSGAEWHCGARAAHGATSDTAARYSNDDACIRIAAAASDTGDGKAEFVSFIDDGVRVDWTQAASAGWLVTAILFGGAECSTAAGTSLIPNSGDTTIVPGFETEILFTAYAGKPMDTSFHARWKTSLGVAVKNGPGSFDVESLSNYIIHAGGTVNCRAQRATDNMGRQEENTFTPYTYSVRNLTSTSFDVYKNSGSGDPSTKKFGWFAVNVGGLQVDLRQYQPPGAPGSDVVSIGFEPQVVMGWQSTLESRDATLQDDTAGNSMIGIADTNGARYASGFVEKDAATTTSSQSVAASKFAYLPEGTGTIKQEATASLNSDGYAFNYSISTGTPEWFLLAIEIAPDLSDLGGYLTGPTVYAQPGPVLSGPAPITIYAQPTIYATNR